MMPSSFLATIGALFPLFLVPAAPHERPPLLPPAQVAAIAREVSGESALRNLEFLAREHRIRGSRGFRRAAEHILSRLQKAGFQDARILELPADGVSFYGTQKSRPAWDGEFGELWELEKHAARWVRKMRICDFAARPVTLAEDSDSGAVVADLVDVGKGTKEADYAGKEVAGKLVLAASQPGPVSKLAVERFHAAGIVSWAQNQKTGWWGEDGSLVRWGHLDSFAGFHTFSFMISPDRARDYKRRLAQGERVRFDARVRARRHPGVLSIVTATVPGADPKLAKEEIVFSCHLDHQRPGANDNASGAVAILEVARAVAALIRDGRLPPPKRTLRFIWPPEVEGTLALLNGHPELVPPMKAVIHMDMVGGGPRTKAVFHVTRGPGSRPSFINDVAAAFGAFVNRQTDRFAATGGAWLPLLAPEGGKEPLLAALSDFTMGSDHEVYAGSSFGIPAIYLNDWPDRYIHTHRDSVANIDPTKLKRAAFLGAVTGIFLANVSADDAPAILAVDRAFGLRRAARTLERMASVAPRQAAVLARHQLWFEKKLLASMADWFDVPESVKEQERQFRDQLTALFGALPPAPEPAGDGATVYSRAQNPRGPMNTFGYSYLTAHFGEKRTARLALPHFTGPRGAGGDYAYEALNFVNGRRTVQAIRNHLAAIYGPVPVAPVAEYLAALEEIDVLRRM